MKALRWIIILALAPSLALAWPWSKDMANQISIKPQEGPDAVRPYPERSVPMDGTRTTPYVHDHDTAMKLPNPNPATPRPTVNCRRVINEPPHAPIGVSGGVDSF